MDVFMDSLSQWYRVDLILFWLLAFTVFTSYSGLHEGELSVFYSRSNPARNSDGKARFISTPASTVYTLIGQTAKLTWKYSVEDRIADFQHHSPTWNLYFPNGTIVQLAYENKNSRTWNVSASCPSPLRNRLTIEPPSSLVISQVSTNDSGTYGCSLRLVAGQAVTSRVVLVITDPPVFTSVLPQQVHQPEGKDFQLICSARGIPSPTIMWLRLHGKQKQIHSQGTGNAELKIRNVRREQQGTYECQATNNPNQAPIINQTTMIVTYRPSIDLELSSSNDVPSWDNHTVNLHCMASGNPIPQVQWTGPDNTRIIYGVSALKGGGLLTIRTKYSKDYGQYRCRAFNSRGYDYLYINVNRIVLPGPPVILTVSSKVSAIELRWRRPTLNGGSPVLDYKVSINSNPLRAVSVKDTSVIMAGLAENTKYIVTIYARNIVGHGNASSVLITTKNQAGTSESSVSGSIVLGVCLPIIFILLLVIVAILVYNWWKRRKRKGLYSEEKRSKPEDDARPRETDVMKLEEGHEKEIPHSNSNGSCFQPFMRRPRRRPGQPRQQPRPLEILDSITEENPDEEHSEDNPDKKHDNNENTEDQSESIVETEPQQNEIPLETLA